MDLTSHPRTRPPPRQTQIAQYQGHEIRFNVVIVHTRHGEAAAAIRRLRQTIETAVVLNHTIEEYARIQPVSGGVK
jgi:hypothetical protein